MTASSLRLAKDLTLPLTAVTQKLAWLGVTGSGKTYGASKLAELLWHAHAQFIVLDPVGVWYGLRLAKDGKTPSAITVPIFGGLHGDVPLESTGGALLANLIVDKTLSAIIDVSQFESGFEKARFARDFADRFFFRKKAAPSAVHLFLEECQEFVPQNPNRGEEHMLHAYTRMQKLGRNFGIGSSYISQRPQEVNKKALNMAQTLFVFRTTGTHERKAIESWIADKSLDQDIAGDLPKIATGHCHVWSPEFLKISETAHILEKSTFNASATPEVGAAAKARELAPIDLDQVRADMAATIEKAKADDPKELRKQIADLRKDLDAASRHKANAETGEKRKAAPALTDGDRALLERVATAITDRIEYAREAVKQLDAHANRVVAEAVALYLNQTTRVAIEAGNHLEQVLTRVNVQKVLEKLSHIQPPAQTAPRSPQAGRVAPVQAPATSPRPTRLVPPPAAGLSGPQQRILNALAWAEWMKLPVQRREKVAFLADASPKSSSFMNNLGALRSAGLIDYPSQGLIALTESGRVIAVVDEDAPTSSDQLQHAICAKLSDPQSRIVRALVTVYPNAIERTELAERAGASASSSSFMNNLGALRSLGLIDYPRQGLAIAAPTLFIEER